MTKTGNLFELAEKQLIKEKEDGIILFYTPLDILEYAIEIRKWLDKNPKQAKQIVHNRNLTRAEKTKKFNVYRKKYYEKTGR